MERRQGQSQLKVKLNNKALSVVTVCVRPAVMRRARWALFGFIVFLFTLIWLADTGRGQWLFDLVRLIPGGDKTGHFALFGLLSLLLNLVLRVSSVRCGPLSVLKGSLIVSVFAIAEEISQLFFSSRTFDLLDLSAGLVGIWMFGRIASLYAKRELAMAVAAPHRKR